MNLKSDCVIKVDLNGHARAAIGLGTAIVTASSSEAAYLWM
jgi:hypothetical protein